MGQVGMPELDIVSGIDSVPVTISRAPPRDLERKLKNPGQPRANQAVTSEHPDGAIDSPSTRSVLQQHVDFWDRDADGVIFPWDTYVGFRRLGFNIIISTLAVPFIHGSFSFASQDSWIPDLRFPLITKNIYKTKHGSDSEVYDTEGRYVPQKMEEIFSKYGKEDYLEFWDVWNMTEANRNIMDPTGWTASKLEWGMTWLLLADDDKKLRKEKVRGMFDGSIFWKIAAEREEKAKAAAEVKARKRASRQQQAQTKMD